MNYKSGNNIQTFHQVNIIINSKRGASLKNKQLIQKPNTKHVWEESFCNKIGWLTQGYKEKIVGTNTMEFIQLKGIPKDRKKDITYDRIVVEYIPKKV